MRLRMVELHVYQNVLIPCTIHVPLNRQLKTTVCCPWVNKCSAVTTGLRHTGMNNYSSQAVTAWPGTFRVDFYKKVSTAAHVQCTAGANMPYMLNCQYSQPPYMLVSTHNTLTVKITYLYLNTGGVRAGWHVRCTLNMDTKELWQWGEAVSLPFGHIPVASEHACKDSCKQSVHTWPVRNSSKECTHHSYR